MPPTPTQPTPAEDDRHHAAPSPPAEDNQADQPAAPTPTHAGDATDGYGRPNGGHDDADGDAHTKQPSPAPVCDDIEEPCVRMNISMDTDELEKELGLPALDAAHDDSHHLQAEVVDDSLGGRSPDFETGKAWEGEQVLDQQPSAGAFEDARMDDHNRQKPNNSFIIAIKIAITLVFAVETAVLFVIIAAVAEIAVTSIIAAKTAILFVIAAAVAKCIVIAEIAVTSITAAKIAITHFFATEIAVYFVIAAKIAAAVAMCIVAAEIATT
uniref:Uncharacterized protein n=1 Tax=Plectus sambesii TaxID=2011161 RepID=A0A914V9Q6_9BILA